MVASFTTKQYNHTARLFLAQLVNLSNLKVMLLDPTAVFSATDTTLAAVAGAANAKEVSGNGWTAGGELFENVTVSTVTTDDSLLSGDEIRVRATGGNIGPSSSFTLYDADTDTPLFFVEYSEPVYAGDGTDMRIPGAILKLNYTAP